MPRKEGPPLEERMQRAAELFELKQQQKAKNLQKLYASRIYKFAKKSSIVFLWITQLILIDWVLPYREINDKISGGFFNLNTIPGKSLEGITTDKLTELSIKTEKGYDFTVDFPDATKEPAINDSIVIYKSLLLGDFKKMKVPRIKENFSITKALTYKFLPFLFIIGGLAVLFIFIKNIEVISFAWLVFVFTGVGDIFFIYYLITLFL
jgi:hypothetical protein